MLCRAGIALPLCRDQKADGSREVGRIVEIGGFVTDGRVMGDIAVARAFGDVDFKSPEQCVLTADPDIFSMKLHARQDEFIIVACDGLWDVMSNQEVVTFARAWLQEHPENDPKGLLVELVEHAHFECMLPAWLRIRMAPG